MLFIAALSLVQLAAAAIVTAPASGTVVPAWSQVQVTYHADNALSSGSKDIYVYREPGHVLLDEIHRPFTGGLTRNFTFTAPEAGPFEIVVYDVITYGVAKTPATVIANVALTSTARR
ncbi:hypothetical protein BDR26DRAFT_1008703 [Obelidium mucronatum]|nr:hypothetical protein BDR26DRAFT_1008703 [Obelidium mucronatum]